MICLHVAFELIKPKMFKKKWNLTRDIESMEMYGKISLSRQIVRTYATMNVFWGNRL
jgi:hypothetical protein